MDPVRTASTFGADSTGFALYASCRRAFSPGCGARTTCRVEAARVLRSVAAAIATTAASVACGDAGGAFPMVASQRRVATSS
eukprot:4734496-Prymnesium_polylepis.1